MRFCKGCDLIYIIVQVRLSIYALVLPSPFDACISDLRLPVPPRRLAASSHHTLHPSRWHSNSPVLCSSSHSAIKHLSLGRTTPTISPSSSDGLIRQPTHRRAAFVCAQLFLLCLLSSGSSIDELAKVLGYAIANGCEVEVLGGQAPGTMRCPSYECCVEDLGGWYVSSVMPWFFVIFRCIRGRQRDQTGC